MNEKKLLLRQIIVTTSELLLKALLGVKENEHQFPGDALP